ncbi:MAG: hypothetical protein GY795_44860 [Desulfobacterales bacterium]|nr:hypothetical protein [Desulfobacterales bacterium]
MKKLIVTTLVIFGIAIYGMAFAQGFGPGSQQEMPDNGDQEFTPPSEDGDKGKGGHRGHKGPKGAKDPFGRVIHENMMTEALVELTGQTAEAIAAELEETGMREFLEANGIEKDALKAKMDEKVAAMAEKLSDCGVITEEQAADILEKLAERNATDEESP